MELVRAASLTGYFAVAGELQLNVTPLLRRAGLSRTMMSDPEQMLPARSVVHLLEDSADAAACTTFGLRMAEYRQLSDLGLVSLLIVHQPTLGDALDVLSEYRNRINSNLTLQVEHHDDAIFLREHFALQQPLYSRQVNDLALGSALQAVPVGHAPAMAAAMRELQLRAARLSRIGRFTIASSTVPSSSGRTSTVSWSRSQTCNAEIPCRTWRSPLTRGSSLEG